MEPINLNPSEVQFVAPPTSGDGNDTKEISEFLITKAAEQTDTDIPIKELLSPIFDPEPLKVKRYLWVVSSRGHHTGVYKRLLVWADTSQTAIEMAFGYMPELNMTGVYAPPTTHNLSRSFPKEDTIIGFSFVE